MRHNSISTWNPVNIVIQNAHRSSPCIHRERSRKYRLLIDKWRKYKHVTLRTKGWKEINKHKFKTFYLKLKRSRV